MPRKKRIWYPGATYHVMSRGNRRTSIFKDKADYIRRYEALPGMFSAVDVKYRASSDRDLQFKMDVEYIDNLTLWLDVKLFFQIIGTVVSGKNVYREEVGQ